MVNDDKKIKLLKEKLLKSFTKKKFTVIADIIDKKNPCSLRIIEWFVSYYSKEKRITYKVKGEDFNVYSSYRDEQMTSFNKKLFDMYRRMERIKVNITEDRVLMTTVAQLNFFHWLFKYDVMDYIISHLPSIKKHMDATKITKTRGEKFFEDVKISRVNMTIYFE